MKIALGLLTNRGFKAETVESLLNLKIPWFINQNNSEIKEKEIILATKGYTIAENRNYLVVQAIKKGCDYLLMVDDDMVFPPNTLETLLGYDKDIVGVNSRPTAGDSKTYEPIEDIESDLIECTKVGTGIILIKTEIFNKIPRPWFCNKTSELGNTINGEDWMFCLKAKEAGFKVWVDTTLEIGHCGNFIYKF